MAVGIVCEPDADADAMRRSVHAWFNEHEGWLLIVDNADDDSALKPSGVLSKALPPPGALGHVLITSRVGTEAFRSLGIKAPLTLGLLDTNAAELLLLRVAFEIDDAAASARLQSLSSEERAAVTWLAGDHGLGRLPLAIVQAGSAIREEGYTFAGYRNEFERRNTVLFEVKEATGTRREEQSVHTTWDISVEALRRKAPAAAELLALCSLLAPDGIPLAMFKGIGLSETAATACPALHALMARRRMTTRDLMS